MKSRFPAVFGLLLALGATLGRAQEIPSPADFLGYGPGERFTDTRGCVPIRQPPCGSLSSRAASALRRDARGPPADPPGAGPGGSNRRPRRDTGTHRRASRSRATGFPRDGDRPRDAGRGLAGLRGARRRVLLDRGRALDGLRPRRGRDRGGRDSGFPRRADRPDAESGWPGSVRALVPGRESRSSQPVRGCLRAHTLPGRGVDTTTICST